MNITGINENGTEQTYNLNEFLGKRVVLYFYPKDNTPGCTQEACDFRDNFNRLINYAVVVGVSPDSIKSHLKFKEKQNLNFILLSDPEHILSEKFAVWKEKSMYGKKYMGIERSTFILDEKGNIVKEWRKVKVKGHVDEILNFLKENNWCILQKLQETYYMKKFFILLLILFLNSPVYAINSYNQYGQKIGSYKETYSGYDSYDKYGSKTGSFKQTYDGYNSYDKYGQKTGSYKTNTNGETIKYNKYGQKVGSFKKDSSGLVSEYDKYGRKIRSYK